MDIPLKKESLEKGKTLKKENLEKRKKESLETKFEWQLFGIGGMFSLGFCIDLMSFFIKNMFFFDFLWSKLN